MRVLVLVLFAGCARDGVNTGIDGTDTKGAWGDGDTGEAEEIAPGSTVRVEPHLHWVNAERYVRQGEQIIVSAEGAWNMYVGEGEPYGPDGAGWAYEEALCDTGTLMGQVGLHFNDTSICVGSNATFTAPRDGLLYFRALGWWEGATGYADVTVESVGLVAPRIDRTDVDAFDVDALTSPEIELEGAHVILHVQTEHLVREQSAAGASLDRFDDWYESHATLSNGTPYEGQRIRFFQDTDIRDLGAWMLSGNPIRIDPDAAAGGQGQSNVLGAHDDTHSAWGFVHELGHDFSFIGGGAYMVGGGPIEGWANVWSLYTLEAFGHPEAVRDLSDGVDEYLADPDYSTFYNDAWLPLAFFMELQVAHGWSFYEDFFSLANTTVQPSWSDAEVDRWGWVRDTMLDATGTDPTEVFEQWGIPLP